MSLTTIATLAGLAAAGLVAWRLGGSLGAGAAAGFVAGASVTLWGIARQRRVILAHPARALQTMVESFLAKLGAVVLSALLLVFVAPLRQAVDWRSFLVGFAGAVLVVLLPVTWDNARILREGRTE